MACFVDMTSSPSNRPDTRVCPIAIALKIIERCEIDLSPGTSKLPLNVSDLCDVSDAVIMIAFDYRVINDATIMPRAFASI